MPTSIYDCDNKEQYNFEGTTFKNSFMYVPKFDTYEYVVEIMTGAVGYSSDENTADGIATPHMNTGKL